MDNSIIEDTQTQFQLQINKTTVYNRKPTGLKVTSKCSTIQRSTLKLSSCIGISTMFYQQLYGLPMATICTHNNNNNNNTHLVAFVQDYPGEPVPER